MPLPLQDSLLYSLIFHLVPLLSYCFLKFCKFAYSLRRLSYFMQVLARCAKLNNLKGSCLVSDVLILSTEEIRSNVLKFWVAYDVNVHCLEWTHSHWWDKYGSICRSATINQNKFIRSLKKSLKFASKQVKVQCYTADETNLFST